MRSLTLGGQGGQSPCDNLCYLFVPPVWEPYAAGHFKQCLKLLYGTTLEVACAKILTRAA